MKYRRFISLLLVLVAVSSFLFAGFSGKVTGGVVFDMDSLDYQFMQNASGNLSFDLYGNTAISKGRGSVYAEAKAMLTLNINQPNIQTPDPNGPGAQMVANITGNFRIDYARLIGPGWEFGFIYVPGAPDYAKSSIDVSRNADGTYNYSSVARPFGNKAPGGYFKYHDYQIGLGFNGGEDGLHYTLYFETPRYVFDDSVMFRIGGYVDGDSSADRLPSIGVSGKFGYAGRNVIASFATDIDYTFVRNDPSILNFDATASFYAGFIGADAYYATKSMDYDLGANVLNLLSARLFTDLDDFGLPMRITFTMKDILARQNMNLQVGYSVTDALLVSVNGGVVYSSNGREYGSGEIVRYSSALKRISTWSAGAGVQYVDSALLEAYAALQLYQTIGEDDISLMANVEVSSKAIVPGAVFRLAWNSGDLMAEEDNLGEIRATCEIEF